MNYIDQLLAKIDDIETKTQLTEIAAKHPVINEFIVDPATRTKNEQISQWAETEWDYEHGMSRREYQQEQEILRLQVREHGVEFKDLNELNEHLGKYIKDNGLMTKAEVEATIKAKEDAFNSELNLVSTLANRVGYLNSKYQKDFGDLFDPDDFVTKANEKGYARYGKEGLDKFYDEFTTEKREAKSKADIEARIEAARVEERNKVLAERGMGQNGQMPTLDGSPEMGHFEMKLKGIGQKPAEGQSAAPPDAELGRGAIARFAAAAADARDASGRVN